MASKKRRKRAYIPPANEVVNQRERSNGQARVQKTTAKSNARGARTQPQYPVPSLARTARRLPIYFVMIFALQYWVIGSEQPDLATGQRLMQSGMIAAFITVLFAPFMHIMDKWAYTRYLRRTGQQPVNKDT